MWLQGTVEEHGHLQRQQSCRNTTKGPYQQLIWKSPEVIAHDYDNIENLLINQPYTAISEHNKSPKEVCSLRICLGSSKQR